MEFHFLYELYHFNNIPTKDINYLVILIIKTFLYVTKDAHYRYKKDSQFHDQKLFKKKKKKKN